MARSCGPAQVEVYELARTDQGSCTGKNDSVDDELDKVVVVEARQEWSYRIGRVG
jgi:hypothetical protein